MLLKEISLTVPVWGESALDCFVSETVDAPFTDCLGANINPVASLAEIPTSWSKEKTADGFRMVSPSPQFLRGGIRYNLETWGIPYDIVNPYTPEDLTEMFADAPPFEWSSSVAPSDHHFRADRSSSSLLDCPPPLRWDGFAERLLFSLARQRDDQDSLGGCELLLEALAKDPSLAILSEGWNSSLFSICSYHVSSEVALVPVFETLLKAGVDPLKKNANGNDALHSFLFNVRDISRPTIEAGVRMLVEAGCTPEDLNKRGLTAAAMVDLNVAHRDLLDGDEPVADSAFVMGVFAQMDAAKLRRRRSGASIRPHRGV